MAERHEEAPPLGEEIHLPQPTLLPIAMTAGITLFLLGLTTTILLTIAGTVIFLYTLVRWIRDTRAEIAELPPEH